MKFVVIGLFVALVYVEAQPFVPRPESGLPRPRGGYPRPPIDLPSPYNPSPAPRWPSNSRVRRSPERSVDESVLKPEHGLPQLNLDYNHKIFSDDYSKLSALEGVSFPDFKQSSGDRMDPNFGVGSEMKFDREPQRSLDLSVIKPERGPAISSLDYSQKIYSDDTSNLSAHVGVSTPDFDHFTSRAGVNYEYTPNENTNFRAGTEITRYPGGQMVPSFGVGFGMKWRRDINQQLKE
ncbi:uncharacterized protein LOC130677026 [Microplitis mediator]|uniref:uncharacterized protein LOC130677026 n=1 Tax=Microplitis mediator TaxID=375433 RepID=UPI002554D2EB|nr:uncharacterized protein LOC130677026 [Microplitis mediator]